MPVIEAEWPEWRVARVVGERRANVEMNFAPEGLRATVLLPIEAAA
jgi:hypothetical protein